MHLENPMPVKNKLRVLVVDDTVVYRKIVSDILAELPDVEVVGVAHNGKIAISKIESLKPDLLTLDIEMPEMNGLEVLSRLRVDSPDIGAIMLSTLTQKGGDMTMQALELGAFDFIPKPLSGQIEENKKNIKAAIGPMIRAFIRRKEIKGILRHTSRAEMRQPSASSSVVARIHSVDSKMAGKSEIIAIGVSTGGPSALSQVMSKISPELGVPILIVQHMPPVFTQSFANSLNSKSSIEVKEAVDGELIRPNTAFIAPGGKQMKIGASADGHNRIIRITDDPPENSCKPSVDYLFKSVAQYYVGRATGVIMTGMGSDGAKGLEMMKKNGATIIAQDEATCVVYGMSKEPIESGLADIISPLDRIALEISRTVK
ncbi:fused chemotaxis regulator; protein-glutamate methylesterase in two-component regulatory system with CheA [uncultured Desulfobacterium sp.]|uniref:Protein-glutamate methylesterase/protein-glutamine glutaminase n=1 Tax=uncultured Desulfobacterium sp. TaxID=201089 RepID=A0A445MTQ2_9BACT|nr:fused chemotaxis regulator; protein-glutamate methylesterase in two-component regulatory system with CheA [uncultured Desulfobacterium sp.]